VTSAGYLRFPHLHDDLLAFVAEDDVWLAPVVGGRAWRVSADHADASYPRFSRDGSLIAWTGHRDGPAEIYLAGTDGGTGRRLTYWGSQETRLCGWTPEGEVLAITTAGQPFRHFTWAHAVPVSGGPDGAAASPEGAAAVGHADGAAAGHADGAAAGHADGAAAGHADGAGTRILPFGPVSDVAMEPAATALLNGTFGSDPAHWKRYRGGTAGRLWLRTAAAAESGDGGTAPAPPFRRLHAGLRSQFSSPMLVGGRLAFLSDHEGTGNLYSCALDGTDLRRHTDHDGFYARNASTDGIRVVYHCAGEVWLLAGLDPATRPARLEINLGSPAAPRAPRLVTAADHLGELSCDATGQASAVELRGTVHWLTHRDGPARALSVVPGTRARLPRVLGNSGQVVWVTDADGDDALEVGSGDSSGPAEPQPARRLAGGAIGRVSDLAAAPDGSAVAVAAHDGRLLLVDLGSGAVTELAASDDGDITGLAWSPDSAWLAWSQPGPEPLSRVRLARRADRTVIDVTDGRFTDTDPVFTKDGLYLAFLSQRSFDPVYDAHIFDLSFPYGCRPYLVPLAAATPSPFGPLEAGRPVGDDTGDGSGKNDGHGNGSKPDRDGTGQREPAAAEVVVDAAGLPARIVQLPVPESRYRSLRAVKGGLAWLRVPLTGNLGEDGADTDKSAPRPALEQFDIRRRKCTELADEVDWFEASGDGQRLLVSDKGKLCVLPAGHKADSDDGERVQVDLSRARFLADPAALWRTAYAEAGRIIRHDFWVQDMADVAWDEVLDDYRPLLEKVAGASDFADLLTETMGELGSSHAYVHGPEPDEPDSGQVGLLGADLERDSAGAWRVRRIVPGESSDPRARSPLAAPGAGIGADDALLAVDGRQLDSAAGPGPLLVGAAGKPVELTIAPAAGQPRRAVVVPLASERRLRYLDWVAGRRHLVRELSQGKLGYLHVPDMVSQGWADFHRDLRAEMVLDALVVDVRGNSGGHTSQLVVEKLARRVIAWDVPRGRRPITYPQDAPRGPVVAICDEYAGSDGDIVTAAIRTLRLGPVVGTRTWGGVIGYDNQHELVEGTTVTVPRFSFWFSQFGWGVENYGVDPDVEVVISPDDWAAGRDVQLETAVRLALEALQTTPAVRAPSTSQRPSRRRPALPPRQSG
jgi:tricorn protease